MATLVDSSTAGGYDWPFAAVQYSWQDSQAQEWEASETFDLEEITIRLVRVGTGGDGDCWLEIWDDDGGEPGSLISGGTSSTQDMSAVATSLTEYTFTFASEPTLTSGVTYYIVMQFDSSYDASNHCEWETWDSTSNATGYGAHWQVQSGSYVDETGYTCYNKIYKVDAGTSIDVTVADSTVTGYSVAVSNGGGAWDVGAYIYDSGVVVDIDITIADSTVTGYNVTISAVSDSSGERLIVNIVRRGGVRQHFSRRGIRLGGNI